MWRSRRSSFQNSGYLFYRLANLTHTDVHQSSVRVFARSPIPRETRFSVPSSNKDSTYYHRMDRHMFQMMQTQTNCVMKSMKWTKWKKQEIHQDKIHHRRSLVRR